jgi:hypothetical protein
LLQDLPDRLVRHRLHDLQLDQPIGQQPQLVAALLGQEPGQGCEDGTVWPGGTRPWDLSAQHRDLVSQHQNLGIVGGLSAGEQCEPAEELAQDQIEGVGVSWPDIIAGLRQ